MAARAATLVLALAAFASAGPGQAEDNPACAQFKEPMTYNACLARHGPKANNLGAHPGQVRPGRAQDRQVGAPATAGRRWQGAHRNHGRVQMEFLVK
jgi:poly(3-hydroxybutyrate) depolymerase